MPTAAIITTTKIAIDLILDIVHVVSMLLDQKKIISLEIENVFCCVARFVEKRRILHWVFVDLGRWVRS